jgi:Zn-dependent M28 family amino/carboxypeptidase
VPLVVLSFTLPLASAVASTSDTAQRGGEIRVTVSGVREHLTALQRIADRNSGNRFAGTSGYDASARYVAARARAAGYRVRFQEFEFPLVVDRTPPTLRRPGSASDRYVAGRDFATLAYSGSGRAEAPVSAVDLLVPSPRANASTSGCEASDFRSFPRGNIALLQRGTCTFREKIDNAIAAGAGAVVVFNEGGSGRRELVSATLGPPQVGLPALAASFELGDDLRNGALDGPTGTNLVIATDMVAEQRRTRNVIAESRTGNSANLVVVGAHLDSVQRGPGINDNGSGSAVVLEIAEQLAKTRPRNRLRFVWWGAEELGLLGSRYYVGRLTPGARARHALYLNFDMVGSTNFALFVYDGHSTASSGRLPPPPSGSAEVERTFTRYFAARGIPYRETGMGGSDHLSFAQAGIPIGGLFTGASEDKSAAEEASFGGRAGQPYDRCYHLPCDTVRNINPAALGRVAGAAMHAVRAFARDTSRVTRAR